MGDMQPCLQFLQIMHKQLFERDPNASVWKDDIYTEESRARAKGAAGKPPVKKSPMVPLHLLAGAYRRKKVIPMRRASSLVPM